VIEVYRLHSGRFPASSGKGAAINGGRWNPQGTEAVYAAASRTLSALEIVVHYAVLPRDFVLTPIRIPDGLVVDVEQDVSTPETLNALTETQRIGSMWLSQTAVFSVPSVIIPEERIYVLNTAHSRFPEIAFLPSRGFRFDPRLKQSAE
jgi:RES domain-containing protein